MVNMVLMYIAPLISTLYCSLAALLEIIRRANTANGKYGDKIIKGLHCFRRTAHTFNAGIDSER